MTSSATSVSALVSLDYIVTAIIIIIIIITPTISNAPYKMMQSLQGRDVPGEFVISQRSGNVSLVPS